MYEYKAIAGKKYFAICPKTKGKGYTIKVFEIPKNFIGSCTANWYFLNRIDLISMLENCYPIELFHEVNALLQKAKERL